MVKKVVVASSFVLEHEDGLTFGPIEDLCCLRWGDSERLCRSPSLHLLPSRLAIDPKKVWENRSWRVSFSKEVCSTSSTRLTLVGFNWALREVRTCISWEPCSNCAHYFFCLSIGILHWWNSCFQDAFRPDQARYITEGYLGSCWAARHKHGPFANWVMIWWLLPRRVVPSQQAGHEWLTEKRDEDSPESMPSAWVKATAKPATQDARMKLTQRKDVIWWVIKRWTDRFSRLCFNKH